MFGLASILAPRVSLARSSIQRDYDYDIDQSILPCSIENPTCAVIEDDWSKVQGIKYTPVMARAMYGDGFKALLAGANANDLINGIHLAKNAVEKHSQWRARVVRSAEEIVQVGTTAANGDRKIGQVVAKAMGRFGNERLFIVSVLKNPFILIYEGEISNEDICRAIASTSYSRRPLVIIARNVDEAEAGSLMLDWNYVGSKVCIIKPPTSQETTTAIMQDIAILTGGKVRASHNETAILGGFGSQAKIKARCEELKSKINESKEDCEVKFARERLAKLSRNLAVFKVGGASKRVQNALEDAKAATDSGTVPGGGVALLHASKELDKVQVAKSDQKRGVQLSQHVLRMPVYSIASTAGFDGIAVVDKLLEHGNFDLGYDPAKGEYVDMVKAGNVDSLKFIMTEISGLIKSLALAITLEAQRFIDVDYYISCGF
ncbi:Chaperonin CPN60-2 [Citrus sinensis]|uniref:Chaperonin CPN60-2 n=1 Tax=Citrus sinensis TaxID=2711 RepID=A0ACB8JLQ4_CITSI|nr:Chaperonin CPN60-2 [Citrus sinensis]